MNTKPDTRRVSPAAARLIKHAEAHGATPEQLENLIAKHALPTAPATPIERLAWQILTIPHDPAGGIPRHKIAVEILERYHAERANAAEAVLEKWHNWIATGQLAFTDMHLAESAAVLKACGRTPMERIVP